MGKKEPKTLIFLQDILRMLLSYGILVYMVLLIVVLPLYFEQGYGYIATDKASFFCKISVNIGKVLLPVLILYAIATIAVNHAKILDLGRKKLLWDNIKKAICKISAIDFFVGMYGVAVVLSYLCSDYREDALWGVSGWYMGLLPHLILVCGYFLIAKFWKPGKWVLYMIFPVATVVFLLGYLNRFGYYPIEMEYANGSFISTIGNINWYCGYVVPVLFAGVGLFWQLGGCASNKGGMVQKKPDGGKTGVNWGRILQVPGYVALCIYICLGFATLTTQGSASGILALGVMMLLLLYLSAKNSDRMLQFWVIALLLSVACVITEIVRIMFPEAITFRDGLMDFLTLGWVPIAMTLVSFAGLIWSFWSNKQKKWNSKILSRAAILCVTLVSCIVLVYVLLLTVNTIHPGAIGKLSEYKIFTFSNDWGSNRGATWKAAVMCFLEQDALHKLVGVGPDAMWSYINTDSSPELTKLIQDSFGTNLRLTNAHNEWLTILVNTGLLGLVSFVGIIVSAVWTFMRKIPGEMPDKGLPVAKKKSTGVVPMACAFGILAHTINNMFSFQQVMNVTMLFLLLGMGSAFFRVSKVAESGKKTVQKQQEKKSA